MHVHDIARPSTHTHTHTHTHTLNTSLDVTMIYSKMQYVLYSVDDGFDEHDIPYDVLWLDIEHTDGKR